MHLLLNTDSGFGIMIEPPRNTCELDVHVTRQRLVITLAIAQETNLHNRF